MLTFQYQIVTLNQFEIVSLLKTLPTTELLTLHGQEYEDKDSCVHDLIIDSHGDYSWLSVYPDYIEFLHNGEAESFEMFLSLLTEEEKKKVLFNIHLFKGNWNKRKRFG